MYSTVPDVRGCLASTVPDVRECLYTVQYLISGVV
jgi:hypothetical protein